MAYLRHFGIKGQKWGVRRYQDDTGRLTPAGKRRYGNNPEKFEKDFGTEALRRAYNPTYMERQDGHGNVLEKNTGWENRGKVISEVDNEYARRHGDANFKNVDKHLKTWNTIAEELDYYNKYAGAALKDMGFNDTEKGRKFLQDFMANRYYD